MHNKNTKNKKPTIVITTGGTGGHMFPAEALTKQLSKEEVNLIIITDNRGEKYVNEIKKFAKVYFINARKMGEYGFFGKLISLFLLGIGTLQSIYILLKEKADLLVGMGGYASFPGLTASIILRKKRMVMEHDSVLGNVNHVFAKKLHLIATAYKETQRIPKKIKQVFVGNILRPEMLNLYKNKYPEITQKKPINILITGGSQGARVLDLTTPKAIEKLPKDIQKRLNIIHQCRKENINFLKSEYKKLGVKSVVDNFIKFSKIYPKIHILIGRAGASSVAEAKVAGIPSIFIPLKTKSNNNHQYYNALTTEKINAGKVIPEEKFNENILASTLLFWIKNPKDMIKMAENAKKSAILNAPERLAKITMDLAKQKNKNFCNKSKNKVK